MKQRRIATQTTNTCDLSAVDSGDPSEVHSQKLELAVYRAHATNANPGTGQHARSMY
jgi:hypothetical protein